MVKTFGAPRECGAPGQLPLLPPPLSGPAAGSSENAKKSKDSPLKFTNNCWYITLL